MQFPKINLNGTDAGTLLQEAMDAFAAVDVALRTVEKMTVHGRDYQTVEQPYAAFAQAQREHVERLQMLGKVCDDLKDLAQDLIAQKQEREELRRG